MLIPSAPGFASSTFETSPTTAQELEEEEEGEEKEDREEEEEEEEGEEEEGEEEGQFSFPYTQWRMVKLPVANIIIFAL